MLNENLLRIIVLIKDDTGISHEFSLLKETISEAIEYSILYLQEENPDIVITNISYELEDD